MTTTPFADAPVTDATTVTASPSTLLKLMSEEERPRERLTRVGGESLSDAELIAVLLRTGRPGHSALDMAYELLGERGGLVGLLSVSGAQLKRRGLGDAKAASLLAALELGNRLAKSELPRRRLFERPESVARYLGMRYGAGQQEVMGALYLDSRHRLLAERDVFRGTLNRALVEPRAILKEAILCGASSYILFHNHPSGDPTPSTEDLQFTRRMAEAGEVLGILLLDHLILGEAGRWVSLQRRGAW